MSTDGEDHWGESDEASADEGESAREFFERFAWQGVTVDPATTRAADFLAQL